MSTANGHRRPLTLEDAVLLHERFQRRPELAARYPYLAAWLARLFAGLRSLATRERRSLLEVSSGIGLAFALSARSVGTRHVAVPYREDWRPLRREGFAAYLRRTAGPYGRAIAAHLDPTKTTLTERGLTRLEPPDGGPEGRRPTRRGAGSGDVAGRDGRSRESG